MYHATPTFNCLIETEKNKCLH